MAEPKKIGDAISEWMKSSGVTRRDEMRELTEAWSRAAGADVAKKSRVADLRRGVLTVTVESAALHQEIEAFLKDELLKKMRAEYPGKKIATLKCILKEMTR